MGCRELFLCLALVHIVYVDACCSAGQRSDVGCALGCSGCPTNYAQISYSSCGFLWLGCERGCVCNNICPPPPTPAPPTPAPDTPAPHTPAPDTPAPDTPAPDTPAPDTPAPDTPAPDTPAPDTPAPDTPAPDTPAPDTPAPDTPAPDTPAPDTPAPDTPAPDTPAPDTPAPDTPAPDTPAPDTPAPDTPAPDTPAPDTPAPDTPAPDTPAPDTPAPDTPAPDTPAPDTPAPDTPAPDTPAPDTPAPDTPAPDTPAPDTPAPDTPAPDTPAPDTPAPDTPAPDTPAPDTPAPDTPAPDTPAPDTPAPDTPTPDTPAPDTPAPDTPAPATSAPPTPSPPTPAPATDAPPTPAPPTPVPDTLAPPTPAPDTPAPLTPAPPTPAPPTPIPPTDAPDTPAPPTPAPITQAPPTLAPPTPAPATQAPPTPAPPTPAPPTLVPPTPAPPTPAPPTPVPPTPAPPTPAPPTSAPPTLAPPTQAPPTPTPCPCMNGECIPGTDPWLCRCYRNTVQGFWGGTFCDDCMNGYWGAGCTSACKDNPCHPCNGHGICSDGLSGNGLCTCSTGTKGNWIGEACANCVAGWAGTNCKQQCPNCQRGICHDGRTGTGECVCEAGWAGALCDACSGTYIKVDVMGVIECQSRCPGYSKQKGECSGNGICVGVDCTCSPTYWGADCSKPCPIECKTCDASGNCVCPGNLLTPSCTECLSGWYGPNCTLPCDCNNNGQCDSNGICTCYHGWGGLKCSDPQPRMDSCPPATGYACSGHGRCSLNMCTCDPLYIRDDCSVACNCGTNSRCTFVGGCECVGNWTKDATGGCLACLPGTAGSDCSLPCVNGVTEGTTCKCATPWLGTSCNELCPEGSNGLICSGNGVCPGAGTGSLCGCNTNWYGSACETYCDADTCSKTGLLHTQCNPISGFCECQDSATGHWGGSSCDTCAAGWWGLQCIDPCECSGHGRCGLTNGVCDCFRDDTNGHWTGSRCSKCETGYTGSTCTVREAIITRTSIPRVVNSNKTTSIVLDDEHRILYVGSDSGGLHLYNYSVWPPRVSSVGTAPHYPVGSWVDTSDVFVIDEASSTSFDVWSIARNTDSAVPVMLTSIVKDENETLVGSCITQDMSFRLAGDTSCTLWHFDSNAVVVKTATVQELTACTVLACTDNGAMLCGESQLAAGWACYLLDKNFKTSLVSTNATGTVVSAAYSMFDDVALFLVSTSNSLRVNEVSLNASVGLTSSIQITSTAQGPAVVVPDPHASSAFVFWQPNTYTPGRAARVQYSSKGSMPVGVNSEISLRAIAGGVLEVVTGAATSAARRLLFGSDGSSGGISAYLMHEVMDTNPRLADVRGGTEVQVLGSGFGDSAAGAKCTFGEDMPNLVDNLTREVVQCTTGEVENEHCGSSVVQVALMSTTATDVPVYVDSSVLIERYSPPDLESIYPVRGNFYGQVVTIKGAGFKPSTVASCVYFNSSVIPKKNLLPPIVRDGDFISPCTATACDATYSTGPTVHVPATVVSDHEIRCVQPNFTGDPPLLSLLDFALDGQVYTGRPLKYEILGAAMGLLSVEKLSVRSDEGDAMRIDVYTVDVHERKLLDKDTEERNVTACLAENSTSTTCMTTLNQAVEITTGRGTTEALLNWPDVQVLVSVHGVTTFYVLFIDDNHGWTSLTTLTILHGTPAKLLISVQPEETTNGMSPLSPQPKLQVLDAFGFVVEDETYLNSLIVTASLVPPDQPTLNTFSSGAKTGIVRFAGVRLTPKFGSDYYLNFSSTTHPSIPSVLSQPISAALCPNTTYQETGKRQCTPCPSEGAICNGSTVLLPEEGYWRIDPASTVFYRCISKGVCLAEKDECAVGSGGALCQSCAKDYARPRSGRKGCTECQRSWVTLQVFAVGTAMLAFMCGVTLWTISSSPTITTMSTRLCVVRIGIIFLQMLGKIDEYHTPFPDPLFSTLFFFGRVSLFDLSLFQPFNCFIGNYFPILEIYILWPVIGAMLAALAYLVAKVVVKGQTISFVKVLATGLSISFYLSYPTLITHLLAYTKCNTYQGGSEDIEPLHKLWVDMSIDCGSDTYKNRKVVATVIAYLDGVVLPVLYLVLFPRIKKWGKADMLVFITGGYKESMWYWPVVVLAREGLVVVPSVYASAWPDRKLQHYLPMWTFQVALVTQIIMQPFQTELANRLETLSLACTTVLLNLSVLFLVNDTPAGAERGLAVLLSMLCFVCCWVFLYYLLPLRWRLVLKRKFGWERRKVQEKGVPLIHCSMLRPEEDTELEQWKPEEDSPDRPVDKACSSAEWTPPSPEGSQHSPTTQSSANMSFSASSRSQRASFQLGGPSFPRSSTAGSSSPSPRSRPRGASLAYPTANHSPQARLSQSFVPKPTRVRINRVQL